MRPIHLAQLDEERPLLRLTRELVRPFLTRVTVAPITTIARGLSTEVPVGVANGLDHEGVVSCDTILTVPTSTLGARIGYSQPAQEFALFASIRPAADIEGSFTDTVKAWRGSPRRTR